MSQEVAYQKIKAIVNSYEGLDLHDKKKGTGNFRFPVYVLDRYMDVDIDVLELTERARNCLKRAGIRSIYDLMTKINGRQDLERIRNCGVNSSRIIMEALFLFQYMELKPEQRDWYIKKIVEMNK